jgi:DtxR family transcriptional regulator, Mn-dependent transcriptional regulator
MFTLAEENYLKTIFHLEQHHKESVSTNAIAERLVTKPSSVTDMVQKLADKQVLTYVKYKGATLTSKGNEIAVNIIRKHRLWEVFLVEKLLFSWDEVHEIAEQLEHIQSEELIDRLDKFLGFPKVDPHGDPIPDHNGQFKKVEKKLLSQLTEGQKGLCVGVKESDSDFLKYLDKRKIAIGTEITVVFIEDFDDSMQISVNGERFFISKKIAENLYVKLN